MRICWFTLLFFILSPLVIFGQTRYQKGYAVTTQGDTLNGFIDQQEWANNPVYIFFKSALEQEPASKFGVADIQAFQVEGAELYERFEVSISQHEVEFSRLTKGDLPAPRKETVFLKTLILGDRGNLYSYRDALKSRFYLLGKQKTTPEELNYTLKYNGNQLLTVHGYRQQLINWAIQYQVLTPALENRIKSAFYTPADLTNIMRRVNPAVKHDQEKRVEGKKTRFFAGIGLQYTTLTYGGEDIVTFDHAIISPSGITQKSYQDLTTHSILPRISAGLDFFRNPVMQRLIIRGELSVGVEQSEVAKKYTAMRDVVYDSQYQLTQVALSASPQLMYNVYNQPAFQWYVGAGLSCSAFIYSKDQMRSVPESPSYSATTVDPYFQMKPIILTALLRTGVMLNKKWEFSLLWHSPYSMIDEVNTRRSNRSATMQMMSLSANYLFK